MKLEGQVGDGQRILKFHLSLPLDQGFTDLVGVHDADDQWNDPATAEKPEEQAASWELRVMGTTIVFHTVYRIDRDRTFCVYSLDETKENDLVLVEGSYHVIAHGEGSRIIYRSQSDSGISIPQWLKKWLASGALKDQMSGIRDRAEAT